MRKVIPSPSVEGATPVLSSGLQAPMSSAVLSLGLWNQLSVLSGPGVGLPCLAGASLWVSSSQVTGSHPPTDLWPHSFVCVMPLNRQGLWDPQTAIKDYCEIFHKDVIASLGG